MFTSFRFTIICYSLLIFGLLPIQASAQSISDLADAVPGISSYSQALQFAQTYFTSASQYTIVFDPDGGYGILYSLENFDPILIQKALTLFSQSSVSPDIDLIGYVSPIADPLIVNMQYVGRIQYFPLLNSSGGLSALAGSAIPALVEFDFGNDGFDSATADFSTVAMLAISGDGIGTVSVSGLTFPVIGDWRYRLIIDPNGLFEPLSGSNRSNNTSPWENFSVMSNPNSPTIGPDISPWKIVGDFDSWGPGYYDRSTGGTMCTSIRGWACDVREGSDLVRIDMIIDGTVYDTFYPHLQANATVNPWWANLAQYNYTPGCPARAEGNTYGYNYPTPASFKDGVTRNLQLLATRSDGHSEYMVNAGWGPVYKNFPFSCAPETNIVDLSASLGLMTAQVQDNPFTIPDPLVRNNGDISTGGSFNVVLQFDHGSDGFRPGSTADFVVSRDLAGLESGQQVIPNFGEITHSVTGQWRVRMIVDRAQLVEPETFGHRSNNATPWRKYSVTSNALTVVPLPQCQLLASQSTITSGQSSILTWNMTNANPQAVITGVGTVNKSNGTVGQTVSPTSDTDYIMTVVSTTGETDTCNATIKVLPVPRLDMTVVVDDIDTYTAPAVIYLPDPEAKVDIDWDASGVDFCAKNFMLGNSISGNVTFDPVLLKPSEVFNYTISCQNSTGFEIKKTARVSLPAFTINLSPVSNLVRKGNTVAFTYGVTFPAGTSYDVNCELSGIVTRLFTTNSSVSQTIVSQPLESSSVGVLTCTEPATGYSVSTNEVKVEVVPVFEEI